MNRVIRFSGETEQDKKLFELLHILVFTTMLQMTAAEDNRHAELQTLLEDAGEKVDDEYIIEKGAFRVNRYKLPDQGAELVLHASQWELLTKISKEGSQGLSAHVKRDLLDLRQIIANAEKQAPVKKVPASEPTAQAAGG